MRGADLSMIFQEPMTSLNPVFTVGSQITEAILLHQACDMAQANAAAIRILDQVRIPYAAAMLKRYPHELSGGMRQRVMIAMALITKPELLIADEPTTALDVTVQAQILELIKRLQKELGMAVIFITHDLGVVSGLCDRVLVMYAGRVVEELPMHAAVGDQDPGMGKWFAAYGEEGAWELAGLWNSMELAGMGVPLEVIGLRLLVAVDGHVKG
jgi:peptide/nickel transport system ATP-binding protein/glutathione transport system ATP-binding protein